MQRTYERSCKCKIDNQECVVFSDCSDVKEFAKHMKKSLFCEENLAYIEDNASDIQRIVATLDVTSSYI